MTSKSAINARTVTPPAAPPTMAPIGIVLELAVDIVTAVAEEEAEAEVDELLVVPELVLRVTKTQSEVRLKMK
jgi:hypothetical protein